MYSFSALTIRWQMVSLQFPKTKTIKTMKLDGKEITDTVERNWYIYPRHSYPWPHKWTNKRSLKCVNITMKQPLPCSFHFCPPHVLLFLEQVAKVINNNNSSYLTQRNHPSPCMRSTVKSQSDFLPCKSWHIHVYFLAVSLFPIYM